MQTGNEDSAITQYHNYAIFSRGWCGQRIKFFPARHLISWQTNLFMERYALRIFRMFTVTLLLGTFVFVTGCVARMPVDSEAQAIQSGKKSIVLFRVTTTPNKDSEPYKRLNRVDWRIWKLDDSPNPKNISAKLNNPFKWSTAWRVPSDTSGKEGWRYLVFDPGNYMIKMIPENVSHESEDDSPGRKEAYYQFPIYRLSIPKGRPLLYAGSFELKRYAESYRGFFFDV
jgi:hypothetical protein